MSEKSKKPRSRRPSYLEGRSGSVKPTETADQVSASDRSKGEGASTVEEDKELYSWQVWLFPRRPAVSAGVVVALLACVGLAYWALPNLMFVAVIAFILFNRLAPYLFPVKYVLTERTVGYKTFLAKDVRFWERVFTYYDQRDGVLLANDVRSFRGRVREGLFLYYADGASNKEEVLSVVRTKVKSPEDALAPKDEGGYKGGVGSAFRRIKQLRDDKER